MLRAGRQDRRRQVFEQLRRASDMVHRHKHRITLKSTVDALIKHGVTDRLEDRSVNMRDLLESGATTVINACEARYVPLRTMLLALDRDLHGHIGQPFLAVATDGMESMRLWKADRPRWRTLQSPCWELLLALKSIIRENRVDSRGWCLQCFKSGRHTELDQDDIGQCPLGCLLG